MVNDQEHNYLNIRCHTVSDVYWTIDDMDPDYFSWRDSTYWFNPKDYKIYTPNRIREKFYTKGKKLSEEKLKLAGFIKIDQKSDNWAFDWFFHELGLWDLTKIIVKFKGIDKRIAFYAFVENLHGITEEVLVVWNWISTDLAVKWCEEQNIPYKLDVSPEFSDEAKDKAMDKIRNKAKPKLSYLIESINEEVKREAQNRSGV